MDLVAFQKRLYKYARKRMSHEDAEDAASFGVQELLEGKSRNLRYRVLEYYRFVNAHRSGRPMLNIVQPTLDPETGDYKYPVDAVADPLAKTDQWSIDDHLKNIKFSSGSCRQKDIQYYREILALHMAGYTDWEIGLGFNIAEFTICADLQNAFFWIKNNGVAPGPIKKQWLRINSRRQPSLRPRWKP